MIDPVRNVSEKNCGPSLSTMRGASGRESPLMSRRLPEGHLWRSEEGGDVVVE